MRTLVLVPSLLERAHLESLGGLGRGVALELVGFGPIAAAARTAALCAERRPERLLLVGVAGRFGAEARPPAERFGTVRIDGVGAGSGARHLLPSELGMPQWHEPGPREARVETEGAPDPCSSAVFDELPLHGEGPTLLTVTAAASSPKEVSARVARHPGAVGEDMEAFGVALAAHLAGVPLAVVRGWSNVAGERDKQRWDIGGALAAAQRLAREVLAERAR